MSQWKPAETLPDEHLRELTFSAPNLKGPSKTGGTLKITWLSHATVLIQCNGLNVITDPVWTTYLMRANRKYERLISVPVSLEKLPRIHACLVSHSHYDHFDLDTAEHLELEHRPIWCVPSSFYRQVFRRSKILKRVRPEEGRCIEFSWWKEVVVIPGRLEVVGLPAQHWSNRTMFDMNVSLWTSFACRFVQCNKTVFFAGDTGYCSAFRCIGRAYGPFDVALLPIGAYSPRYLLERQHVSPKESVQIHRDVRAKRSLGIHWGTWALSNESVFEPREKLKEALTKKNVPLEEFICVCQGESLKIK